MQGYVHVVAAPPSGIPPERDKPLFCDRPVGILLKWSFGLSLVTCVCGFADGHEPVSGINELTRPPTLVSGLHRELQGVVCVINRRAEENSHSNLSAKSIPSSKQPRRNGRAV